MIVLLIEFFLLKFDKDYLYFRENVIYEMKFEEMVLCYF